jgi:hypothetical protein
VTAAVEERTPLTPEEIRALPAVCPAQATVCAVWGISPAMFFKLLGADELPVPTFTVGRSRKVYRADILRAIGEDNGDGAGAATPTPLAETHATTSSDQ